MALNPHLTTAAANLAADQVCALCNAGFLDIYDGAQPATADTAITTQVRLASLLFSATAFGASSGGVATANAITSAVAGATSTAAWFRAFKSDHTTVVFDGTVGTSGCNLNLTSVAIVNGGSVVVSSLTYTQSK